MTRWIAPVIVFGLAGTSFAAPAVPADIPPPSPEVVQTSVKLDMPAVPAFELPPAEPGFENPRRLRVSGRKQLGTQIKVKGTIVWIYSCLDAVRQPKESAARAQKRIDDDPTLCERPRFILGDTRDTDVERGLWVVKVPRLPNKLEKQRLPKEELKNWPKVPKLKVGDTVAVTGTFALSSPHGERNSDGLLVFEALEPAKPAAAMTAAPTAASVPPKAIARPKAVALVAIEPKHREASKSALAEANKYFASKQFTEAIRAYGEATAAWPQNHVAWYGLGGAHASRGDWQPAFDAFEKAKRVHPDVAMYQMWAGVAAYEKTVLAARNAEAKKQGVPPEQISVDLQSLSFELARERLELAVSLDPKLWRAQFYLGRVRRAADQSRDAAMAFTQAAAYGAQPGPYIALAELYRKWDYLDQAAHVAAQGLNVVPQGGREASDLAYLLGMALDDKRVSDKAIESFTRALDYDPDNHKARFQRGQVYFRLGKWVEAKADLDAFAKAAPPSLEFAKQQANKMLVDLATKKPAKKK